jgi:hypothetical protein
MTMKRFKTLALAGGAAALTLVAAIVVPISAQALGQYPAAKIGVDISYPSCSAPVSSTAQFGIVGVSGGRVYTDNACAAAEASHFSNLSIYVNTGLNTSSVYFAQAMDYGSCAGSKTCGAYWYGYLAGVHAYNYAKRKHLAGTRTWWLDVELMNTWNASTALNNASIRGEHDGLAAMTPATATRPRPAIGVYARAGEWKTITGGGLKSRNWPVWFATGLKHQTTAQLRAYCAPSTSFTSGPVDVVQWIGPGTLNDLDYGC